MTARTYYRAMRPAWAFDPLSGKGAATNGGRWNAKGVPALYLAGDPMTALAEYNQDIQFRPVTLAEYHISGGRLADGTTPESQGALGLDDAMLSAAWRAETLSGKIPTSWDASERLRGDGFLGLLYRSRINQGVCLVMWSWNQAAGCKVTVSDLDGRLPKDNRSWRPD